MSHGLRRGGLFDPKRCVEDAVEIAQAACINKDIKIECCIQKNIPLVIGDETRFNQILTNLIGNAVKYTDKGEIVVKMEQDGAHCPEGKCRIRVSVRDTGLGICPQDQAHIFDAFTRFHEFQGARARGGVGLGLYITKTLVDLMKGEISVVSQVGVGSEFIITLDLNTA